MKTVPLHELKQNLSSLVREAEEGETIIVTRHNRPVVQLGPTVCHHHLHVGSRVGKPLPKPLRLRATKGKFLAVLQEDRNNEGGWVAGR